MSNYDIAPAVLDKVHAGEITMQQATESHAMAMLLAGFLHLESQRDDVQAMFDTNDRQRFIEGLQSDPKFMQRFGMYLAEIKAA